MKKFITAAVLAAAMILPQFAQAETTENIYFNNKKLDTVYSDNGETKIAIRSFFEDAGYTVLWSEEHSRVTIFNSDRIIYMYTGNNVIFLGETGFFLSSDITYIDDNVVMPVDAVKIALDASVEYKGNDIYIASTETCDTSGWKYKILSLTNAEREKNGLSPLVWNSSLSQAAESHCRDMISRGYFSHTTPEGLTPFDRLKRLGIKYTNAAENLAAGQPDPESVFNAWLSSEKHRKAIMNPKVTEMGAAFVRGGKYGIYWAQEFATTK